jgi:hypothetical protein
MKKLSLQELAKKWPSSIVARTEIKKFTGGIITERYCANLDSQGIGIKDRIRIGRKIAYPVDAVIEFLENRAQEINANNSSYLKTRCKKKEHEQVRIQGDLT